MKFGFMISHNAMKKFWLNCMLLSIMHSQLKLDLPSIFWGRFREIESNQLYIHILLQLQWFGHWHYRLCDSSINRFICNVLRFFFLKFSTMSKLKSGQVYYKLTQLISGTFPRHFLKKYHNKKVKMCTARKRTSQNKGC